MLTVEHKTHHDEEPLVYFARFLKRSCPHVRRTSTNKLYPSQYIASAFKTLHDNHYIEHRAKKSSFNRNIYVHHEHIYMQTRDAIS